MIDWNTVLQSTITALLLACGGVLYKSVITLTQLQRDLVAHTQQDAINFAALKESDERIETYVMQSRSKARKRRSR